MFYSSSILRLNDTLFDEDALIFRDVKSSSATLKNDVVGKILRVDFEDFSYLGIWAKPKAPYVCIEPWIGIADHVDSNREFMTKERLMILDASAEEEVFLFNEFVLNKLVFILRFFNLHYIFKTKFYKLHERNRTIRCI